MLKAPSGGSRVPKRTALTRHSQLATRRSSLPVKPRRQLQLERLVRRLDPAEIGRASKPIETEGADWVVVIRAIEQIVEFRAEGEHLGLRQVHAFLQCQVHLREIRTEVRITARVANARRTGGPAEQFPGGHAEVPRASRGRSGQGEISRDVVRGITGSGDRAGNVGALHELAAYRPGKYGKGLAGLRR